MLRFEDHQNFLEIDLLKQVSADSQSRGDAQLTVRVSARGYSGHNDLWILASDLRSFCRGLVLLERDRRGTAILESVVPEELRIVVRSVDSLGHMLVEGSTGHHVQLERSRPWHSVAFGIEFDPSQLTSAISVDWLRANAWPDDVANAEPAA